METNAEGLKTKRDTVINERRRYLRDTLDDFVSHKVSLEQCITAIENIVTEHIDLILDSQKKMAVAENLDSFKIE